MHCYRELVLRARHNNLQQKLASSDKSALISSRFSQSTRYQTLLNEIQKTELALAQQRLRYTDNFPMVQKLMQQRQSQIALLRQEVGRSLGNKAVESILNTTKPPMAQGQLGDVELKLVEELIQVQTTFLGLIANEQSLARSEQILRSQLGKYPGLIAELAGEGKTTLALGLAVSAARMHQRVLVIDANLRKPSLHNILELSNEWGLSLLLVDKTNTPIPDYVQPIHPAIDVLTARPIPDDTVKLLSSKRMKELLEIFEQSYDLVLINAPPILDSVDARIIASFAKAIAMVARLGKVTRTEFVQATETANKLNAIGIIANEASNTKM
ncbi:MAG: tyrosine-protein kinase family protein [Heteroscytonema crispum UTEX LB 1556]